MGGRAFCKGLVFDHQTAKVFLRKASLIGNNQWGGNVRLSLTGEMLGNSRLIVLWCV